MDETSGAAPTQTPPSRPGLDGVFDQLRELGVTRRGDDKWVAGVGGAIATRLNVDPLLVRGVILLFVIFGGIGVPLYLLAWALLPNDQGEILAENGVHGHGGGIVLLVAIALSMFGSGYERWWIWLVLVPAGVFLWWVVNSARAGKSSEQMGQEAGEFAHRLTSRLTGGSPGQGGPGATDPSVTAGSATFGTTPTAYALGSASVPPQPGLGQAPGSHGAGPHGMGPGRTGAVATAPRVVRSRRRRAGLLGLLLTAGLAAAAYALGSMLDTALGWPGSPELIGTAFALAGAGLALVVIGATGRRAGFASVLVAALAVVAVASTAAPTIPSGGFGERTWSATTQPAQGFALTAGDAILSLAGATPGSTVTVAMGAGQLKITVPKGTTATLTSDVRVGEIRVKRGGDTTTYEAGAGPGGQRQTVVGSGSTTVAVHVTLAAGQLTVIEES